MNTRAITIDPDGTQELGVYVIVEENTETLYEVQCGGHATELRSCEGYLVPVDDATSALPVREFFARRFNGDSPPAGGNRWTPAAIDELADLVSQLPYWSRRVDGTDTRHQLEFDRDRVTEVTEAWVPVNKPDGRGILIFKNSD